MCYVSLSVDLITDGVTEVTKTTESSYVIEYNLLKYAFTNFDDDEKSQVQSEVWSSGG